jgi:hypothetical protein
MMPATDLNNVVRLALGLAIVKVSCGATLDCERLVLAGEHVHSCLALAQLKRQPAGVQIASRVAQHSCKVVQCACTLQVRMTLRRSAASLVSRHSAPVLQMILMHL